MATAGGVNTVNQYLNAGLIDELCVHIVKPTRPSRRHISCSNELPPGNLLSEQPLGCGRMQPIGWTRAGRHQLGAVALLAGVALAAGVWVTWRSQGMWTMAGTAGMSTGGFVLMWATMMTAMMLPSIIPFARLYTGSLQDPVLARTAAFASGYLLVWAGTSIVAYGIAGSLDVLVMRGANPSVGAASALLLGAAYYATPMKRRLLGQCRNPIGLLIQYGTIQGIARDFRVGVRHGFVCLGCCWSLMLVMFVFGVMNVLAMAAIAFVVAVEKLWRHGEQFARGVGVACALAAIAVLAAPDLASGLIGTGRMSI